eukprot:358811-Chlamydomonas_euryale.AAC.10
MFRPACRRNVDGNGTQRSAEAKLLYHEAVLHLDLSCSWVGRDGGAHWWHHSQDCGKRMAAAASVRLVSHADGGVDAAAVHQDSLRPCVGQLPGARPWMYKL